MRPPAALALLIALSTSGVAREAGAAGEDDDDARIRQGLALRRQGRDTEALEAFRSANLRHPTPRAVAQVALAEQALGQWVAAEADLLRALDARDDAWIGANRGLLESGLATIRARLGSLVVTADVDGAELWVNDARVATLPSRAPLRVEAGTAVVEVRAPGYAPVRRITEVLPGGSSREALHLVPLAGSAAPTAGPAIAADAPGIDPTPRPRPPDVAMRRAGYVALGAGALGLAAGAYFGVRTLDVKSQRDAVCTAAGCASEYGVALDGQARGLAVASTAWLVAGTVAVLSGASLVWVARSRMAPVGAPGRTALTVSPDVGPDRAGVLFGGLF